jgi:glycosyltransferase involved in cell wall biosynthesis
MRTDAARKLIIEKCGVTEVSIVVVSDGSTDRTVELALKHSAQAGLIVFEKNKGYGAAIKAGWEKEDADLLGFIDADGTCDPLFFIDLCNMIVKDRADIALGNRMNKESKMPFIRRVGNLFFSLLLTSATGKRVYDTASGMRVIRKTILSRLMPLPDGLHFTPAMSARAILSNDLKIMEKPMSYHERVGESKLNVWKDSGKFLSVILENAFLYIPNRIYTFAGSVFLLFSIILMLVPIKYYLSHFLLLDWMLYRFIVSTILALIATLLFCISNLTRNIVNFALQPDAVRKKTFLYYFFEHWFSLLITALFYTIGTALVFNSVWSRITTGMTNEHWSRYIVLIFFYTSGTIFLLSFFTNKILGLIRERLIYLQSLKNVSR